MKRFWKAAAISKSPSGLHLTLDKKLAKTPAGRPFVVPHSKPILATALAAEWTTIPTNGTLRPHSLPLSSIVVRAIDSDQDERRSIADDLIKYFHTDSICYTQPFPQSFVDLQNNSWSPIREWAQSAINARIQSTDGFEALKQSPEAVAAVKAWIDAKTKDDPLALAALESATLRSKSILIAMALIDGFINANAAATAARLELIHQISKWGEVEDSHDTDKYDLSKQLAASAIVALAD